MIRSESEADHQPGNLWLLTDEQTAKLLAVTPDTIRNLHRTGQLRGVLVGRHLRWRPADVRHFIDNLRPATQHDLQNAFD